MAERLLGRQGGGVRSRRLSASRHLEYLKDAFLFSEAKRWDVKGKSYFDFPVKYYAEDPGLRNARLDFRDVEPSHMMENVIYNELIRRGCQVDVGVVPIVAVNKKGMHELVCGGTLSGVHFLTGKPHGCPHFPFRSAPPGWCLHCRQETAQTWGTSSRISSISNCGDRRP